MSPKSLSRRFWTRPARRVPPPAAAVGRPLEQLEDRVNPVITLVPGAGGLYTFNSDGANDILQIQATANPADVLYNSGGIGLASLTGVTRLVFNGNGGTDLLIVQSPPTPAPTHFAPVNGIQFNGGGDAGDELDMIGGASTWTGTYNPTGVQAGTLGITNSPGVLTQNIGFTGVSTIRNSLSGTTTAITTPGTNDTINVETGPNLGNIGAVQQGPVLIDGGDRDDTGHGSYSATSDPIWTFTPSNQNLEPNGWSLAANANITNATTVPHTSIQGTGNNTADFYRIDVPAAGSVGTFDIDATTGGLNTLIGVYDHHGTLLAFNDNAAPADAGSSTTNDSFLSVTFPEAEDYYVVVTRSSSPNPLVDRGVLQSNGGVATGTSYTLHVSLQNHALVGGSDTVAEVEPNQTADARPAGNRDGWLYIQQAVDFVMDNAFIASAPANTILSVGTAPGTQARAAFDSIAGPNGLNLTRAYVSGAANIAAINFSQYKMIYVPTGDPQTTGGITQAEKEALAARVDDIKNYINSGGGIFALTEDSLTNPYNWLQIPAAFVIQTTVAAGLTGNEALYKTQAAIDAGLTIADPELSRGVPYHNIFTGPAGFNNLLPFVRNSPQNQVVALGLGAIQNPGLGGAGPSTAITFGTNPAVSPTFPKMYLSATTGVSLNGAGGADTYNVQLGTPVLTTVSIADAGGGPGDVANLFGTTAVESFNVNSAAADTVQYAGPTAETVAFAGLETLTLDGKNEPNTPSPVLGDTFTVRPHPTTAVSVAAGGPLIYPGDTLQADLIGLVGLNPTLSDPALPAGTLALTGYGLLSWTGVENFPVPRGLGGSFDFGPANGPVPFGFTQVLPSKSYPAAATEGTGWHGWATTPQYGNQAYLEPNPPAAVAASPVAGLLLDYAYGFGSDADVGVFRVDIAPDKPLQLTAVLGIPAGYRDGQVVEWGVANTPSGLPTTWTAITPAGGLYLAGGEMTTLCATLTAAQVGNNLSLFVRFRDIMGEPFWSVSALDVRPLNPAPAEGNLLPGGLVAPLPVRREYSTDGSQPTPGSYANQPAFAAVPSDGTTIDYYRGKDAIPNSLVTITVTNGAPADAAFTAADTALGTRVLNADAAGYVRSFQVQADGVGEFTFGVRRPTGTATSTVTVADVTGFRAGAFTQAFALPSTRRLDFGPLPGVTTTDYGNGGTVGAGYAPFADATYTSTAANALGWAGGTSLPVPFTPGGTGATAVQTDGVFGGYAPSEFVMDMPSGTYVVTATLGDLAARRNDISVEVFNGTSWVFAKGFNPATGSYDLDLAALTSPVGVSPNGGMSMVRSFVLATANNVGGVGQLRVRFGNASGNPFWSLSALEARPAQATLTITRTAGTLTADGATVTGYTVTGAAAGTVLTVRPALGSPDGTDANTTYDGFQVVVPPSGTATFAVKAPFSTTAVASIIELESVSGAERGTRTESYAASPPPPTATPSVRRFDFNSVSDDTNPNMLGVRGNQVWTAGADYGWLSAVGEFERAVSTMPASMTAAQKSLFRDGATLGGTTATFRVKVSNSGADYMVRYYVGDSYKKWPWIRLQVEGGTASGQLATNVNQYWSYVMTGKDADADGYLDVKVFGSATWVLNAIDVALGNTASVLPPSLFAPSPQLARFKVTGGTAPRLTGAELAPVVAEAVSRWAAAGADPARLAAVTVSITDLNDAGRLGEHVPGSVHIDDDAGGRGWFVDPTPADDAEFAAGAPAVSGVDLLTVVMHELGHELGLDDADGAGHDADLMAEALDVGVRRLPAGLTADMAESKVELPTRPPVVLAASSATVVAAPTPALWLDEAEAVSAPGAPVADDRVKVATAAVEPARVGEAAAKLASALALTATPAWPDADALLDLDGVYVG